jgi:hypothetical protein
MKNKIIIALIYLFSCAVGYSLSIPILAIPCCADYDGDGVTDLAVFHPLEKYWEVLNSKSNYTQTIKIVPRNINVDYMIPVVGDFDGDNKADYVLMLPTTGEWLIMLSGSNYEAINIKFGNDIFHLPQP